MAVASAHRITIWLALVAVAACSSNKKDVEHAKHSLYDTDFANVYNAALTATRNLYPNLNESPGPGKIETSWHQVVFASNQDDLANQRVLAQSQGIQSTQVGQPTVAGMPTRLAYKRFFIRFDVSVVGGRPWRVKVTGHASEWEPGAALPVEMRGANRPPWLDARIDALRVAIYKRVKQYAVPMKEEIAASPEDNLPKTDPKSFTGVPAGAATTLAAVKTSLSRRDYSALRPLLDEDIVWSLGGGTGADVALATWQADPTSFEAMDAAIGAGCAPDGKDGKQVACPAGAPKAGVYQVLLEERNGSWKVTSFVRGE